MKIKICDNEKYRNWIVSLNDSPRQVTPHYVSGDVFEVIPYKRNTAQYYEVEWNNLTSKQRIMCPKLSTSMDLVFWINKDHTCEDFLLPEELFKI